MIGLSMIGGGSVSMTAVIAIFLSNVPEGLSSAAGMKKAGRSLGYVLGVWGAIALASGAILAMIGDTMMPEAFEQAHEYAGLITVGGFLAAFGLSKLGG